MIYRSKAPLRIGLAGGGTDVSPYCDLYGGAILNATISLYANATIEPYPDNKIVLEAIDRGEKEQFDWSTELPINGSLDLLKGVYNRIQKDYGIKEQGFRLSTFVDAPAGSGLGTSSTLVVAIVGAFTEMLRLPLGEYDMAIMPTRSNGMTWASPADDRTSMPLHLEELILWNSMPMIK
jgi:Predicted kinase related to galactokinase and mevalonate kinase